MKDNKICFSKTLLFLVLIGVAIVVGLMATRTGLNSDTKASGKIGSSCAVKDYCDVYNFNGKYLKTGLICTEKNGAKTWRVDTGTTCIQKVCLYNQTNVLDQKNPKYTLSDTGLNGSICVVERKVGGGFINQGATCVKGYYRSQYDRVNCAAVAPAAITCTSTGFKMVNSKCYNMGSKLFNAGTSNQYCGNEEVNASNCTAASFSCMYDGQIVTNTSAPYKWVYNRAYKCIQTAAGANNGYRCKTDVSGVIIATGSVRDTANCSVAAPTPITCTSKGYGVNGGYCYKLNTIINSGQTNQYCGNLLQADFTCCNDPNAAGC
ncbi:MAG: hypothetical protein AAB437_03715 [Patescibacteria group bacterium]